MEYQDETGLASGLFSFMDLGFTRCPRCNDLISRQEAEKTYCFESRTIDCPSCQEEIGIRDLLTH